MKVKIFHVAMLEWNFSAHSQQNVFILYYYYYTSHATKWRVTPTHLRIQNKRKFSHKHSQKTLCYHLNYAVYRKCQSNQSKKSLIVRRSINHKGKTNMAVKCENITKRLTRVRFALVTNFHRALLSKTRFIQKSSRTH